MDIPGDSSIRCSVACTVHEVLIQVHHHHYLALSIVHISFLDLSTECTCPSSPLQSSAATPGAYTPCSGNVTWNGMGLETLH